MQTGQDVALTDAEKDDSLTQLTDVLSCVVSATVKSLHIRSVKRMWQFSRATNNCKSTNEIIKTVICAVDEYSIF